MSDTRGQVVRRKLGDVARFAFARLLRYRRRNGTGPVGQAVWHTGRTLHLLLRVLAGAAFIVVLAGGGLAWRLAQRPLELDWLTRRLEAAANAEGAPPVLMIGSAALAWEGFTHGVDQPLDIRLTNVALLDAAGTHIAEVPRADVSLSAGWLVLGRVVPRALEVAGVRVRIRRGEDGRISVNLGRDTDDATPAVGADATAAAGPDLLTALLRELSRPTDSDADSRLSTWAQLRRVRIRNAALTVDDRELGATWRAADVGLEVVRRSQGGAEADAEMTLMLGPERVHTTTRATLAAGASNADLQVHLSPVNPARLAALAPGLAALSVLDAPVALSATAVMAADLIPEQVKVIARVGPGGLRIGPGSMPLVGALAEAEGSLTGAVVRLQRLELTPRPGGPRTVLRGRVLATRAAGRLDASVTAELDQVAFTDLAALWPVGVGGRGTRPWITENVTEGTARNGRFDLHLTGPDNLSDVRLTALAGGLDGQDLTIHWMRPVPPLEHVNGRLSFVSPDEVEIVTTSGRQGGGTQGGLLLQSGRLRIVGLSVHDQFLSLEGDLTGTAADLLAVLKHPRLHLLDRRPLEMRDPSGAVSGRLSVTRMPLKDNVTVDDMRMQASGKVNRLHLGGLVVGRDVDQGILDFNANNDGMKIRGTAQLGGIPSQVQVDLDFRNGGPADVVQRITVSAAATGRQLAGAGVDVAEVLDGPAFLQVNAQGRRDDRGEVTVRADLGRAVLQLSRLNFRKPAGLPASGELHLTLDGDTVTGVDAARLDGEGIAVSARIDFAGGNPQTAWIERMRLGDRTDASGELRFPRAPGDPWVARLTGRSIDAAAEFGHGDNVPRPPDTDQSGPPWRVDARFDRVLLGGDGRELMAVAGTAESDGRVVRQGTLTGQTGAGAAFRLVIAPGRTTRTLTGSAEDAGGLLRALDLLEDMRGGRLTIEGVYEDRMPGHPLHGTAEIVDFRMRNAPGLAKLLQVMTLYGLVEVLQGPGLGFDRLVVPFQLTQDTLDLTGARAFSASLGMTAKGRLDLNRHTIAVDGTIVPAYILNMLLGRIPLIGRLFSPEPGGGLFAATYSMHGPLADPAVTVNPLAALTPGFLRGVFGIFDGLSGSGPARPSASSQGGGGGN